MHPNAARCNASATEGDRRKDTDQMPLEMECDMGISAMVRKDGSATLTCERECKVAACERAYVH